MLTVQPLCKLIIMAIAVVFQWVLYWLTNQRLVLVLSLIVSVWLWLYLSNLEIKIENSVIIKRSGNIFKHVSFIMLKNIYGAQVITIAPWRPALVRLHTMGEGLIVIGLNGRQAVFVEKQITDMYRH